MQNDGLYKVGEHQRTALEGSTCIKNYNWEPRAHLPRRSTNQITAAHLYGLRHWPEADDAHSGLPIVLHILIIIHQRTCISKLRYVHLDDMTIIPSFNIFETPNIDNSYLISSHSIGQRNALMSDIFVRPLSFNYLVNKMCPFYKIQFYFALPTDPIF